MTQIVSVSDFRQDISKYFDMVEQGDVVVVRDEKKGEDLVKITHAQNWNPAAYGKMLQKLAANPISAKDHPEWATRAKVNKWLRQTRASWNRELI